MQELTLVTKPGEGFGLSLSGGVNGYHGNPLDETDEGIFISQVSNFYILTRDLLSVFLTIVNTTSLTTIYTHTPLQIIPGGAAEIDGRLKEGTRILQVRTYSSPLYNTVA